MIKNVRYRFSWRHFSCLLAGFLVMIPLSHAVHAEDRLKSKNVIQRDYNGFTLWIDCSERGAIMFRYNAQRDEGNFKRENKFSLAPDTPAECQQKRAATYAAKLSAHPFDRGHLVTINHLDNDKIAMSQSNYMTNIWPQTAKLNRGAWEQAEELIECVRDTEELLVLGGPIMGDDAMNDFFLQSHGVRTPDYFWKVVVGNKRSIAWIMPNDTTAEKGNLDKYIVTIDDIEKRAGLVVPVEKEIKSSKALTTWEIPKHCNRS